MSVLELLRAYTLREYAVVLAMAVLASLGLVFMLNSMGGGTPAGETLLKRETVARKNTASLRFVEQNAVARARAKAAAPQSKDPGRAPHRRAEGSAPGKRGRIAPRGIHSHCDSHHSPRPGARADPRGQHCAKHAHAAAPAGARAEADTPEVGVERRRRRVVRRFRLTPRHPARRPTAVDVDMVRQQSQLRRQPDRDGKATCRPD